MANGMMLDESPRKPTQSCLRNQYHRMFLVDDDQSFVSVCVPVLDRKDVATGIAYSENLSHAMTCTRDIEMSRCSILLLLEM